MTRRTTNPVTRAEARKVLLAPIRDVEHARLAASYLDLLDALGPGRGDDLADLFMAATFHDAPDAPEDDPE